MLCDFFTMQKYCFTHTGKKMYSTNFIFCYIFLVDWGKSNIFAWFL